MNDFLWQTYHRLLANLESKPRRFIYEQLSINQRLTGIIGPRGVGKTTVLLQFIKDKLYDQGQTFYFSADNTYFNEQTILAFVDELYTRQNIKYFFIDEIHQYPRWSQELKNIYDAFPEIKIFFSGSSSIDLIEGTYDLSRRAKLLHMPGLSFREYLNMKTGSQFSPIDFDDLLDNHMAIASQYSQAVTLLSYFSEYLRFGYYPFVFEGRDNLYHALETVIDKTIYEDIANFYTLKTNNLVHFKRILNFLASIPPGNITTNNIAKKLQIDNKTVDHYLYILQRAGMIKTLYPMAHGNQHLSKPSKIYLDNTTLLTAINTFLSEDLNTGTMRELFFLQSVCVKKTKLFYPAKGDFAVDKHIFEVGGRNKTWEQLKAFEGSKYLVKDDILIGSKNEIPLYLFGFLY